MTVGENRQAAQMEPIHISTTLVAGPNRRMIARARSHEVVMDVRKERGGDNAGPSPPELMAMALGGCIFNLCRVMAMQRQVPMENIRVAISGHIDPSRAFGLDTGTRAGFSRLSVQVAMDAALPDSEKTAFFRELVDRCPLCDTIAHPTSVQISMAP